MKAIVFGGSGFLGSHVADALTNADYETVIFDVKKSSYLQQGQEMIVGDISDRKAVEKAVVGCEVVYNFAGIADIEEAYKKPIETVGNNVLGTTIILEACRLNQVKRFVFASSIYVYSELGGFYRCSKQAAELYIEEYQRRYGVDFTILRYGTLYGPRADERNSIYRYLKEALTKGKIVGEGTGDELREYIHVRDAAKLSVDILSEEYKNKHIILTGHYPMKFGDLLHVIQEILNNKVEIVLREPTNSSRLAHYSIAPYSFTPKVGQKLVTTCFTDLGQGLLECLQEIQSRLEKGKG